MYRTSAELSYPLSQHFEIWILNLNFTGFPVFVNMEPSGSDNFKVLPPKVFKLVLNFAPNVHKSTLEINKITCHSVSRTFSDKRTLTIAQYRCSNCCSDVKGIMPSKLTLWRASCFSSYPALPFMFPIAYPPFRSTFGPDLVLAGAAWAPEISKGGRGAQYKVCP